MGSFVEEVEIGVVGEDTVAALAGQLAGDAGGDQRLHGLGGGGERHPMAVAQEFHGEHRPLPQGVKDAKRAGGGTGGSGKGTKARTFSPAMAWMWNVPVALWIMVRNLNKICAD